MANTKEKLIESLESKLYWNYFSNEGVKEQIRKEIEEVRKMNLPNLPEGMIYFVLNGNLVTSKKVDDKYETVEVIKKF